jgi:hypothetical protein
MVVTVSGTVVPGYQVASRPSKDYPYGTLEKQFPLFKERGLDLENCYLGTLNISITPYVFEMVAPAITFRQVAWTDLHPPEDFSFSACSVWFKGRKFAGHVYYPHPETKKRHFESASILEIISVYIPDIQYGDRLDVELKADEIHIRDGSNKVG